MIAELLLEMAYGIYFTIVTHLMVAVWVVALYRRYCR